MKMMVVVVMVVMAIGMVMMVMVRIVMLMMGFGPFLVAKIGGCQKRWQETGAGLHESN